MVSLADALLDLRELDRLARLDTPIHRLEPRAKVLATALFLAVLASFGPQEVSSLLPLALFPVALAALGGIPFALVARKVALGLPFILVLGAFLPWLERSPALQVGPLVLSTGWLAYGSLLARGILAMATATVLVAATGFGEMCAALDRLGAPRAFSQQLLFLHRYLFLVGEETDRARQARGLRAAGRPLSAREFGPFAGHLLLRSWERAERVHLALCARGFAGTLPQRVQGRFRRREWAFLLGWAAFFLLCRWRPLPALLGSLLPGGAP
ncbi:MAG: cobalt ECF transporter T component CbiQ [Acidobacteriota bacterium]|nr:cobalt ECF transporter T component CbiQ [Acidobacteriota bacterium]